MRLLDQYLQLFEGEPAWLIVLVSVVLLVGIVVIAERLIKISGWIFLIALLLIVAWVGIWFFTAQEAVPVDPAETETEVEEGPL